MFLRKLYFNLIKILNNKLFLMSFDSNLFTWEKLIFSNKDVRDLDLFKKMYLCVFPDFYADSYNILNVNTLRLMRFRKKFLPNFSVRFETYIANHYSVLDSDCYSDYFDFLKEFFSKDFNKLNKLFKHKDDYVSLWLMFFFLEKHFYKYFSLNFFKNFKHNHEQLTKLNFIFLKIFFNEKLCDSKLTIVNLEKYNNWFNFINELNSTKPFILDCYDSDIDINSNRYKISSNNYENFRSRVNAILNDDLKPQIFVYSLACFNFFDKLTYRLIKTIFRVKIDLNNLWDVSINSNFFENIKKIFPYRFSESSLNKFINLSKIDDFIVFYLRKIKIFNKGRYSRNRQTYRTGFYWCLWLNIFVVYGLHFVFYRFTFTFGYLWLFLFVFFASFVFSRALKYNLISYNSVVSEVWEFFNFLKFLFLFMFVLVKKIIVNSYSIIKTLFYKDEPYKFEGVTLEDFDFEFTIFRDDEYLVKLYNDAEDYFYEIFKKESKFDFDVVFKEDIAKLESEKSLRESLIDIMYLTDVHDIASDMIEERMILLQRQLIDKLKKGEEIYDFSEEGVWELKYGKK